MLAQRATGRTATTSSQFSQSRARKTTMSTRRCVVSGSGPTNSERGIPAADREVWILSFVCYPPSQFCTTGMLCLGAVTARFHRGRPRLSSETI